MSIEDLPSPLRLERRGATLLLHLDRPATRNAIDEAVHEALLAAVEEASSDPAIRAVVLRGEGPVFLSGGDLKAIRDLPFERTLAMCEAMRALLDRIEDAAELYLAAIEGDAYGGGCEVLTAFDYRIAEPGARFSFKQAAMGLSTGWGAAKRLARLVPRGAATRLLLLGEQVEAEEARAMGLLDEVRPAGGALPRALLLAERAATLSPSAVHALKQVLREAYGGDPRGVEEERFAELWGGPDHREALAAFFEKRGPRWRA